MIYCRRSRVILCLLSVLLGYNEIFSLSAFKKIYIHMLKAAKQKPFIPTSFASSFNKYLIIGLLP